jgi:hypothetical protein
MDTNMNPRCPECGGRETHRYWDAPGTVYTVMKMIYPKNLTNEQIAEEAYLMADAMLKAREEK